MLINIYSIYQKSKYCTYMRHSPAYTIIQIQNWSASGGIETMLLTSPLADQF